MEIQEQTDRDMTRYGRVDKKGRALDFDKRLLPDEPYDDVRFINLENKGTPLAFCLPVLLEREVPKRIPHMDPATGRTTFTLDPTKKEKRKVNVYEYYHLLDTYTYHLPVRVIRHINSLAYPVYENVKDQESGQMRSKRVSDQPRFTCTPVSLISPVDLKKTKGE